MNARISLMAAAALILLTPLLGGCVASGKISAEMPESAPPLVENLPLSMGIHYPVITRGYFFAQNRIGSFNLGPDYSVEIGPPTVRHFDRVFAAMFRRTVALETDPVRDGLPAGLDGAVIAEIRDFTTSCGGAEYSDCGGEIQYRFTLVGRDGRQVAVWDVHGEHGMGSLRPITVQSAIRAATGRFLIGFYGDTAVKRWLAATALDKSPANEGGKS